MAALLVGQATFRSVCSFVARQLELYTTLAYDCALTNCLRVASSLPSYSSAIAARPPNSLRDSLSLSFSPATVVFQYPPTGNYGLSHVARHALRRLEHVNVRGAS
jgi:hypothetical protein